MDTSGSVLQDYKHDLLVAKLIVKQRHTGNYTIIDMIKESKLGYSVQKNSFYNQKICPYEDFSDTDCIRGEFI